ncbi:MAG: biotin/lipoyl-containing protein [Bacteroidota bacterium]
MRVEVKLPFLDENFEYCRIRRWLVKPGEVVEIDQDLAELEADGKKIIFPSPVDGKVIELAVAPGILVATDEVLLVIEEGDIAV